MVSFNKIARTTCGIEAYYQRFLYAIAANVRNKIVYGVIISLVTSMRLQP